MAVVPVELPYGPHGRLLLDTDEWMEYTFAYSSLKGGDMGFSGGATARVLWRPCSQALKASF